MKPIPMKLGLVAALLGAAAIGHPQSSTSSGLLLLAFGVLNSVVSPRGTGVVRVVTVAATGVGLAIPDIGRALLPFLWLMWPPAFLIAWSIGRDSSPGDADTLARRRARIGGIALVGAVGAAAVLYELIRTQRLEQTSALFIGIPTLLAMVVV